MITTSPPAPLHRRGEKSRRDDGSSHRHSALDAESPKMGEIAGQARNDAGATKSRRDDILLTVGFNLRKMGDICALQSPAGTTLCTCDKYRPCGTWEFRAAFLFRRLKPMVNKVMSLQDNSPLILYFYFFIPKSLNHGIVEL